MLWWTSCFWLIMQVLWSISTISCCPCIFDKIFLSCVSRLHIFLLFSPGTNQRNCKKERTKSFYLAKVFRFVCNRTWNYVSWTDPNWKRSRSNFRYDQLECHKMNTFLYEQLCINKEFISELESIRDTENRIDLKRTPFYLRNCGLMKNLEVELLRAMGDLTGASVPKRTHFSSSNCT